MALKAQSLAPHWFTPKSQEGDQNPAQFRVRPLSSLEMLGVADSRDSVQAAALAVLGVGVLGWKNVENPETGEALEFSHENLWTLPSDVLDEVGEHLLAISRTSEGDAKN